MNRSERTPKSRGLYDASAEKDACGLGLVVDGEARARHSVVSSALGILERLAHRGASGADGKTGDGAGILLGIPDAFFRRQPGFSTLPAPGRYAVAQVFLPRWKQRQDLMRDRFAALAADLGLRFLGERKPGVNSSVLGSQARLWEPSIRQWFVGPADPENPGEAEFRRKLYLLRQRAERELRSKDGARDPRTGLPSTQFYVASLSHRTIVYKGLLQPADLRAYFADLAEPAVESAFALVHSRFSTNTLPSWELAHPYRYLCHNGEINTLRGNLHWMQARERTIAEQLSPGSANALLPLIGPGQSDSQCLDNLVELLVQGGRSLPHALTMAMPEVWETLPYLAEERKACNAFHSLRLEPWDGPAAIGFADGEWVGACLDRNGLRPCRYHVLRDGTLVLASEAGVLASPPELVARRGRLSPGSILAFHLGEKRLCENEALRQELAAAAPFSEWRAREARELPSAPPAAEASAPSEPLPARLRRFGYTEEEVSRVLLPMLQKGEEALSSMGNDTPPAVLSHRPQPLFRYFRQMFAQVTNPPIDPEREKIAMSLTTHLGPRADLFSRECDDRPRFRLASPFLSAASFRGLLSQDRLVHRLPILFERTKPEALEGALRQLCLASERAVRKGATVLVLSDRDVRSTHAAIPSLLAVSAVHHHLIRRGLRTEASLVADTGEARDVHHFACLLGFGADAVHQHLIPELAARLLEEGKLAAGTPGQEPEARFLQALDKGLRKIMSKMGISTLPSYCGAQIFEILGLSPEVVQEYFPSTATPIGGLKLGDIAREALLRHEGGDQETGGEAGLLAGLPPGGEVHFRADGEAHFWNPETIAKLQISARRNDPETYAEFSAAVEAQARYTLRGLLELRALRPPVPLEMVEPAIEIMRRFSTGAMSFGALGKEAHESLAIAMNRIGASSNSGEGGEDPARFAPLPNGDSRNSAIKQVASGRFGVTSHYLAHATELQIKMAQGAKPGEGGQLPGHKVDAMIARLRHSTPGVTLISPPPHHDIYSIEDLAQLIFDLKNSNPLARVSVKLVAENGVGTIAAGVAKAHADKIVISGDSGGTGASPLSSIHHAGAPWELGLAEAQQALVANGLRGRVRLEADGQLKTGRDVLVAALLGADCFGFSTAPLITQGCIMMRKCHLNTCPVGVATQDPELRAKFQGQPEHLIRYFHFVAEEVRALLARLGFRSLEEAIGRTDCLVAAPAEGHWKARDVDLSRLLAPVECRVPDVPTERRFVRAAASTLFGVLDQDLVRLSRAALEWGEAVRLHRSISTADRATGTLLSYHVSRRHGANGLPAGSIHVDFRGAAGQSFGAFLAAGITLRLEGEANDYVGKGLSGGSIRIFAPRAEASIAGTPVLAGNTCLYGATSGELFIAGAAGERFAVRNSGALAVVEGAGEHCCEYMTGGRVVVLGSVGKNFAAGMSGGIAYVYDPEGLLPRFCNPGSVGLEKPTHDDALFLLGVIHRHWQLTGSDLAESLIRKGKAALDAFAKVMPAEYKKILAGQATRAAPEPGKRLGATENALYG